LITEKKENVMGQPQYSIEARSLSVAGGAASHNFWVLRDQNGNAVAELHGLATDRKTGKAIPIGTDANQHSLRGWHFVHDGEYARNFGSKRTDQTYIRDGQLSETVFTGDKSEVLERWKSAAKYGLSAMNARNLNYPPGGLDFPVKFDAGFNVRVGDSTVNSNSVYNTFGRLMGVKTAVFDGPLQPGIDNQTLSDKTIWDLRYRGRVEIRQGALPEGAETNTIAGVGDSLQNNRFYQQATQALQSSSTMPKFANEFLPQVAANIAGASQQPPMTDGKTQIPLDNIASVNLSKNGRDVILSDKAVSEAETARHILVPLGQVMNQPIAIAYAQLQSSQAPKSEAVEHARTIETLSPSSRAL
jgi:hypothetical protein